MRGLKICYVASDTWLTPARIQCGLPALCLHIVGIMSIFHSHTAHFLHLNSNLTWLACSNFLRLNMRLIDSFRRMGFVFFCNINPPRTLRSALPYPFLKVIWKTSRLEMKAASRVRLCLPLPPTPTSSALPRGDSRMRFIRQLRVEVQTSGKEEGRGEEGCEGGIG